MLSRVFLIFAVMVFVAACETTPEEGDVMIDTQTSDQRDGISGEPLSDIYDSQSLDTGGPIPGSQADLVVNVGDRIFFDTDQYSVNAESRMVLEKQANWLLQYPNINIIIEGHADERGTREYNLALGERRANATENYLVALGVDPRRIDTVTYGKERPAVVGNNADAWAQNRRAVAVVK